MPLPIVKCAGYVNSIPSGTPSYQVTGKKDTTLISTYGSLALRSQFRGEGRVQVELPPGLPITFNGLFPITAFLHNFGSPIDPDSKGVENVDRCERADGRLNYKIIHGIKYDAYPRNEVPYSMLYDSITPENDFHSYELMQKLTDNNSPSFIRNPISIPVRNALDLGCGDGHWVAHAAQAWGTHGTMITGIDIPLPAKDVRMILPEPGAENTKLLLHNFITEELPFPDNSFDYVRLNDVVAAIPRGRWDFVLSEVHRVLSPGGRFELIHDQLCFPSVLPEIPISCTIAPSSLEPDWDLSYVHEAADGKDAVNCEDSPPYRKSPYEDWEFEMRNCRELETLYLEMLAERYGIHPHPHDILVDIIKRQFSGEGSIKATKVYVCLPSQDFMARSHAGASESSVTKKREIGISISIDWGHEQPSKADVRPLAAPPCPAEFVSLTNLPPVLSKKAASVMGVMQLSPTGTPYQPPGVIVVCTSSEGLRYPMTFLPVPPAELDMHSNKHVHSVLSAKLALEAYIEELRENGKPSMSREALGDALWQYGLFRRKRFNWPEMDAFADETESRESEGDCVLDEQKHHFTLSDIQTVDGLTPIRVFEIFEVVKPTRVGNHTKCSDSTLSVI
ncbi:hypothetical protein B0F90DRAFT_1813428 [Multifurca ochricompacta]|uniref:Methyltransferase domain-containing protein n=1 Tax=Multifurca ochricompacta TaxID=376703 RepID=A0AAD4MGD7_9AGAM|nr:hypothetical protein B0F90DRAFT_1813428 [Multifurca ochricompacta]